MNRGWGPISPVCDGTAPHWLESLYHWGGTALWSSNQSTINSQRSRGFYTVRGGDDRR